MRLVIRTTILAVSVWALMGCSSSMYQIDRQVVEDIREGLLVDYGRIQGRIDSQCAPSATDPVCGMAREHLRKLADAYQKLKAAAKLGGPIDPDVLRQVLPLITTLAPLVAP